jgi:hypothetical protein
VASGGQTPEWLGETLRALRDALRALARDPADPDAQGEAQSHALYAAAEARQHAESDPEVVGLAEQARAIARDILYVTGMGAAQADEALAGA